MHAPQSLSPARLLKRGSGLIALVAFLACGWCSRGGDAPARTADAPVTEDPDRALHDLLRRLQRAWQPAAHEQILDEAEERRAELEESLERALAGDVLLREAIAVAAATRLATLRPPLEALCVDGVDDHVRHDAIVAAEAISSWSDDAIGDFLEGPPVAQLAALEIVSAHHDGPWRLVVALLSSPVEELRRAALAAIPEQLPPDALDALCRLATSGNDEDTAIALAALEHLALDAGRRAEMAAQLPRLAPEHQIAALRILASQQTTDAVRDAVWGVVREANTVDAVRGCALWCLEQTDAFTVDEIRRALPSLDDRSRYFAARCLLRAGERDGVTLLVDILDATDPEVASASRWLLATLTGRSPGSPASVFADALDDDPSELTQVTIPPAPSELFTVPAVSAEPAEPAAAEPAEPTNPAPQAPVESAPPRDR